MAQNTTKYSRDSEKLKISFFFHKNSIIEQWLDVIMIIQDLFGSKIQKKIRIWEIKTKKIFRETTRQRSRS